VRVQCSAVVLFRTKFEALVRERAGEGEGDGKSRVITISLNLLNKVGILRHHNHLYTYIY